MDEDGSVAAGAPGSGPADCLEGLIVGGGISGLSFAHWLGLSENPRKWELWEATGRLGGTIGTDRFAGYSIDWGPNGFLDREPLTLRLVDELNLSSVLEPADESSQKRFILKHGRLHPVPMSPFAILGTGLLDTRDKLRLFLEPLIPARKSGNDESVFDFAARRIGRGAAESFIDPMVSGIFGGLARDLSLPACFPVMREMEERYGGLVRALIAKKREKKAKARKAADLNTSGPAGPGGRLTSFRGGLDALIVRLRERLEAVVRVNRPVVRVTRKRDLWEVTDQSGSIARAKTVVCACPTFAAARMFAVSDPELSEALDTIPYAPIVVVATGHRREDVGRALDGFGFLIPRTEGLRTLGSIWTSSIFSRRAPHGSVQFRSMLGGAGDPGVMQLTDDELWNTLRREIGPLVDLRQDPDIMQTYRWDLGIPQYTIGHVRRRERLEELIRGRRGLHFVGNAFYGVGLNDCVKMAHRVAQQIRTSLH